MVGPRSLSETRGLRASWSKTVGVDRPSGDAATSAREEDLSEAPPRMSESPRVAEASGDVSEAPPFEPAAFGPPPGPPEADADNDEQQEAEHGIITTLRPQTARERRIAALRLRQTDAEVQASAAGQEDWRNFDVSKALSALKSTDPAVRRKALQRLHLRWWHAGSSAMKRTLAPAGAPSHALAEVDSVVQACAICRRWSKPSDHTVASYRLVFVCNE